MDISQIIDRMPLLTKHDYVYEWLSDRDSELKERLHSLQALEATIIEAKADLIVADRERKRILKKMMQISQLY